MIGVYKSIGRRPNTVTVVDRTRWYVGAHAPGARLDGKDKSKIDNAGWHFGWMGGVDRAITKFKSFSHQEHQVQQHADYEKLKSRLENGQSIFGDDFIEVCEIDETYPKYVRENQDRFARLIKKKLTLVPMKHFYQTIGENWFTYPNLYRSMVQRFDNAHFVEVGAWKGRSAAYMGVEIYNSGKNIRFDCIDLWEYSNTQSDIPEHEYTNLYQQFLDNVAPLKDVINPIKGTSIEVSALYEDESLDFVFIDAAHDYDNVKKDISAWFPKVKKGGVIAGHDYTSAAGVKLAVDEFFKDITVSEECWIHEKL